MSVRAKMLVVLLLGLLPTIASFAFVHGGAARFAVIVTIFVGMTALVPWASAADQRPPELFVEYRNPSRAGDAVVDRDARQLQVVLVNRGKGPAEAVEVLSTPSGDRSGTSRATILTTALSTPR